ncbi:odorant receptor 131-2-like [Acipenser oxyrinchus oxyrinchus]|uniref:Odorant receptor 131-2-like n=1 Tax=Acipenser oxyrinchus oxyrinchus TaxID=40147 RepID=A0AAD8G643_ACIOX|nr:odorant receptor 131-2-like [Acipenser oxyrinchus oxyrinchus]
MDNLTFLHENATQPDFTLTAVTVFKICVVIPFFCIFMYSVILMLYTFYSQRQFWQSGRYVLFAHMLVSDTIHLLSSIVLLLLFKANVQIPFVYCQLLIFISNVSYMVTPINLATMSLERYIAICNPLRHAEICRVERCWIVILMFWIVSCVPFIAHISLEGPLADKDIYSGTLCRKQTANSPPSQKLANVITSGLCFALVATTVLYTYVRILLETRKVRADKASARKALKTVLLHGIQLGLCMLSFTYPVTEDIIQRQDIWFKDHIGFLNYFSFMLMPRFLSPLIYGVRDETFKKHMKRNLPCYSSKITPE